MRGAKNNEQRVEGMLAVPGGDSASTFMRFKCRAFVIENAVNVIAY